MKDRGEGLRYFPKWQLPKCAISQAATPRRLGYRPSEAPQAVMGA